MKTNLKLTIDWVLEQVKSGKPIISVDIVPTLKEKRMRVLRDKLSKKGIQVWWSQKEPSNTSVILPRNIKPEVTVQDGYKSGTIVQGDQVMILPIMKS